MADPTVTNTPEKRTPKNATAKKKGLNKTMLIVGVLIILVLGGINIYYFKKNKELQKKLDAKQNSSTSLTNADLTMETDETEAAPGDKQNLDEQSTGTPQ
jgi:uncharacterized protein HemX